VKKRIGTALLGHRVITIERRRVGQVNDNWVLGGVLSRETTKKRGAHVGTSSDKLSRASRQWWERLMRRLKQIRNS
jgi:glycine/D-amino acid oxidase-like deaminating enzyme